MRNRERPAYGAKLELGDCFRYSTVTDFARFLG